MDTSKLAPGYTHQAFSLGRARLYDLNTPSNGYLGGVMVTILSKTTRFIEIPFKAIEDIALGLINLVGAIFNRGCRNNLKHCGASLLDDLGKIGLVVALITRPIFALIGAGAIIALSLFPKDCATLAQNCRNESLTIDAIRKHGYNNIREILSFCDNTQVTQLLNELPTMGSEEFADKIEAFKIDLVKKQEEILAKIRKESGESRTEGVNFPENTTKQQTL